MNMEDAALKIEGHEHEIKSLKHRMADVERDQQALIKLTASVEVMATKQEEMGTKVSRIDEKMTEMEGKSAKRWDSLYCGAVCHRRHCHLISDIGEDELKEWNSHGISSGRRTVTNP